ncbi:MAG: cytochrome c-type biogenesis protein CcmH [Gammaproteobacteria bacterium]|nr:cytochrome c-type biogenesis protein CcmH [Gammaproteobacteria bacterium]MCZ6797800.1 cytochrome c-type biogenesis protein CcmH [Gammaproteobacteria bacterium]
MCLLLFSRPSDAAIESYEFKSAQMESDFNILIKELRCLVCQNQNLAGSNSDLAKDLRRQTYELLTQGKTPDQVVQYMIDRYGDFVLYRPRLKRNTLLLWFGPFVLLALVLWLVIRAMRKKQVLVPPDAVALQRARQLLSDNRE